MPLPPEPCWCPRTTRLRNGSGWPARRRCVAWEVPRTWLRPCSICSRAETSLPETSWLSMADGSSAEVTLRDVIIVGGGCYGTFYAGQLLHAAERKKISYRTLLIVDRNPQCRFALEIGAQPSCRLI